MSPKLILIAIILFSILIPFFISKIIDAPWNSRSMTKTEPYLTKKYKFLKTVRVLLDIILVIITVLFIWNIEYILSNQYVTNDMLRYLVIIGYFLTLLFFSSFILIIQFLFDIDNQKNST